MVRNFLREVAGRILVGGPVATEQRTLQEVSRWLFSKALALRPDYVEAQIGIGVTHFKLGRFEEAAAAYERALELDPRNHRVHLYLGDVYGKLGRADDSRRHFDRARKLGQEQL